VKPDVAAGTGRKILFISYHFPPSTAVGGQRIANFAAAVRALAWQPRVLTVADADIAHSDPVRLKAVAGVPIERVAVRRTALGLAEWVWKRRPSWKGRTTVPTPAVRGDQPPPARNSAPTGLRRAILSFLALPDWERNWCLPAIIQAVRIVRRERIKWIMTSCPPYSVHLIGLAVKALTGAQWIADFRDPWMTTGSKRMYPTTALSLRIEAFLERRVVERADLLVFNVERLRNAYRERYRAVAAEKFAFIPNGIATATTVRKPKYDVFTIAYTGSLYVGRSPEPVLAAVALLMREGRLPPDGCRVRLVGQCGMVDGVPTQALIDRYGLGSIVEVQDPVPYRQALEIVCRSHLALLLAPNLPYQIPAKVYDYLGAGTRILAIAEEGGTADLLRETGAGQAFSGADVEAIAGFIHAEYTGRSPGTRASNALGRYDVRHITEELIGHIARIDGNPGASAA
jgi:hypothetical protein